MVWSTYSDASLNDDGAAFAEALSSEILPVTITIRRVSGFVLALVGER